jgi:hypothetical protein
MERGAFIGGNLYIIDFNTETSKYRSFLPTIENIMDSFSVIPENQGSTPLLGVIPERQSSTPS